MAECLLAMPDAQTELSEIDESRDEIAAAESSRQNPNERDVFFNDLQMAERLLETHAVDDKNLMDAQLESFCDDCFLFHCNFDAQGRQPFHFSWSSCSHHCSSRAPPQRLKLMLPNLSIVLSRSQR